MRRGPEIAGDFAVTGVTCIRADKFRPRDTRRRQNRAIRFERAAGKQNYGEPDCAPGCPQQFLALTMQPPS